MESLLVIVYGDYGVGKTVDSVYAAPESIFIAERMAVQAPARAVCGIDIPNDHIVIPDGLPSMLNAIKAYAGKVASIVVDDFSLIAQQMFTQLEKQGLKGFDLYGAFRAQMFDFRMEARRAKMHVFVNAHDGVPHLNELTRRMIKGGPKLPGQAQEEIVGIFDSAFRAVLSDARPVGWPAEFHVKDDAQRESKDRLNVVLGVAPANLGEVLRARGYGLPRRKELLWLDEAVSLYADALEAWALSTKEGVGALLNRAATGKVIAQIRADVAQKYTQKVEWQNWLLRDVYDRVIIRALIRMRSTGPASLFGG